MTFVSPLLTHREDPRHDLDIACYSLVKSYHDRNGTTYPDMPWEPKRSFNALARHFAERHETSSATEHQPIGQPAPGTT
jgi:hypothetical protein